MAKNIVRITCALQKSKAMKISEFSWANAFLDVAVHYSPGKFSC
jgi:hypothetical protein